MCYISCATACIRLQNLRIFASVVQAKHLLERVAKQVQPVMHKHSWTVPLLSELSSKNGRLWVRDTDFMEKELMNAALMHAVSAVLSVLQLGQYDRNESRRRGVSVLFITL